MNIIKATSGKIHVAWVKVCNINEPTSAIIIKIIFPFIFYQLPEEPKETIRLVEWRNLALSLMKNRFDSHPILFSDFPIL